MKQKNLAMLGVAVGCGLVAAIAVAKLSAGGGKGPETARVLVAKKDIPLQTKLEAKELDNLLVWAEMPKALIPPDAVTDLEQVKDKELNRTLKQGNPVSQSDLGLPPSIIIPEGHKQITVRTTQVDAVAGFVRPGSKVDVMYIDRQSLGTGKGKAGIILRNMLVLAVNAVDTLSEKTGKVIQQVESISIAVTDSQARLLALAEQKGIVKFILRPQGSEGLTEQEKAEDRHSQALREYIDDTDSGYAPPVAAPPVAPPVAPPAKLLETAVVTRKAVPMNTLVNADNVGEYFATIELKTVPAGVVTNPDDLKGKFIIKSLTEGQYLFKSVTGNEMVKVEPEIKTPPVAPPKDVVPTPAVISEKKRFPRFETTIVEGGRAKRVIWLEVAPGKWKRFDSEREADAYQPEPESGKPDDKASPGQ
ncbi:MAG TPA: Flp pilus assembly protein CpaB [Gemmataceae bacterium]|nr:Flp pilus assembly protein CpaB [Gemmataceae bacterium]